MKRSNIFLLAGASLLLAAILFIWCAIFVAYGVFPWPLGVTYTIYGVYLAVTCGALLLSAHFSRKEAGKTPIIKKVLTGICLSLTGLLIAFLIYLIAVHL